ncbi:MAG: hypothetical protein AB1646_17985 [Thermodesulfobacteriota bacterium]
MILNVFTITELFIELVTLIVMVWAGILSLVLGLRWKPGASRAAKVAIEERSHLVLLMSVIVMGIRLVNWPFFYATLHSLIPDIEGAMCIFGVTQVERKLCLIAELLKPISFVLIGAWLVIHMLDERTETSVLMRSKLLLLSLTSAVVVGESLVDAMLILRTAPGTMVTCCTTVTDILDRSTAVVPQSLLGPQYSRILSYAYVVGNMAMILVLAVVRAFMHRSAAGTWRGPVCIMVFIAALLNAVIFVLTQIEVHAPVIMHLPYHRCLYCLWQYVPDTLLMYSFFVLATAGTGWAVAAERAGRTGETAQISRAYVRRLYGLSAFCLAGALIMNTVHLFMA